MARQLELKIKAINQRYVSLKNTFGADSRAVREYEQLMNKLHTTAPTSSGNKAIKRASQYTTKWKDNEINKLQAKYKGRRLEDEIKRFEVQFTNELKIINRLYKMPTMSEYRLQYTKYKMAFDDAEKGIDRAIQDISDEEALKHYNDYKTDEIKKVAKQLEDLHETINNNLQLIYENSADITTTLHRKRGDNLLSMKQVSELIEMVNDGRYNFEKFDDKHRNPEELGFFPEEVFDAYVKSREEFIKTEGQEDNYIYRLLDLLTQGIIDEETYNILIR